MIKRDTLNIIMNPRTTIGVLNETEVLLVDTVGGKSMLRSLLLPAEASDLSGLAEFLWQAELTEVWVMPTTSYSRTVACAGLAQVHHWTTVIHRAPSNPERSACVLLWPREGGRSGHRRLALAFPEHSGWGWVLPDAKTLLATVTYLDQVLGRSVADAPELVAPSCSPNSRPISPPRRSVPHSSSCPTCLMGITCCVASGPLFSNSAASGDTRGQALLCAS